MSLAADIRTLGLAVVLTAASSGTFAFDLDSGLPIRINADNAKLDDTRGQATYTGNVDVTQGEARLNAERVILYRENGELNRIEAFGRPATYRQPAGPDQGATQAQALRIIYSASANQLEFEDQAVVEQGEDRFRGQRILYDTQARIVTARGGDASGTGDGRVEMTIHPREKTNTQSN